MFKTLNLNRVSSFGLGLGGKKTIVTSEDWHRMPRGFKGDLLIRDIASVSILAVLGYYL